MFVSDFFSATRSSEKVCCLNITSPYHTIFMTPCTFTKKHFAALQQQAGNKN